MVLLFIFVWKTFQVRKDPVFRREGNNIHVDAVLSLAQVAHFPFLSF